MSRSFPSIVTALLSLTFAAGCPADSGDTDTDALTTTATDAGTTAGTTAGTDAGTTAGTSEPTTGGAVELTCEDYCTTITANCSGVNNQYGAGDTCNATCAAFPAGTLPDMAGNTLGCRLYHAGAAAAAPEVHCVHAGPGGADACGSNCESFCTVAADLCPTTFADDSACQTACAAFDKTESYDAADASGDTFACRLYHLTAASVDSATHCPHIAAVSDPCK